jgi:hypothetical protein
MCLGAGGAGGRVRGGLWRVYLPHIAAPQPPRLFVRSFKQVVVKVQHGAAARAMRTDLANLGALSAAVERLGLQLGFDHGSLVREYQAQVRLLDLTCIVCLTY